MYVSRIVIENYKSFRERQEISLKSGFNVIVGQNNSGKSALLEAIACNFGHQPHRSERTVPEKNFVLQTACSIDISFCLSNAELKQYLRSVSGSHVAFPCPDLMSPSESERNSRPAAFGLGRQLGADTSSSDQLQKILDWFCTLDDYEFKLRSIVRYGQGPIWEIARFPSFGLYDPPAGTVIMANCFVREDGSMEVKNSSPQVSPNSDLGVQLAGFFASSIYRFNAERFNIGQCAVGTSDILQDQARNLAEFLSNLQPNRVQFGRYVQTVRYVLPDIKGITIHNMPSNQVEVRIWNLDPRTEKDYLAQPLDRCGTGISQILAILYVALSSVRSRIILIDEPQSFLHPGAARKLIEVLREHPQHQYVLATHSAVVISAAKPETITLVQEQGGLSALKQLSSAEKRTQEICLSELGTQLSDVFGADRIVWVEGPTEANCFPRILEKVAKIRLGDIEIVPLRNTGDLHGKLGDIVLDIYRRLSRMNSLVPPALAFILDSEDYSPEKKRELATKSAGLIKFLPRRMFENYFLHSAALAEVMNNIDNFRPTPVASQEVQLKIEELRREASYFRPLALDPAEATWQTTVHAKELLKKLFNHFSETRVAYSEIDHGIAITEILVTKYQNALQELSEYLRGLMTT